MFVTVYDNYTYQVRKKEQKVCRTDLDLRGVVGQAVQSMAEVTMEEN